MTTVKSDILTSDGLHLKLMAASIEVDKELLKYTAIKKVVEDFKNRQLEDEGEEEQEEPNDPVNNFVSTSSVRSAFNQQESIKELIKQYEKIRLGGIREVNIFINQHMFNDVFSRFNTKGATFINVTPDQVLVGNSLGFADGYEGEKKKKKKDRFQIFRRLSDMMKVKSKQLEETYSINVLEFFAQVKGLTKANKDTYVNRLTGYIVALKNCDVSGQTALKEQLVRDMVVNKYESVLYANDFYYVVTEDQVVNFVKKTEKGVRLTYVKNYMRVIPPEVVKKIEEANKFEIFDNYAILHYDPEAKAYAETIEETKKRMDPILFGLIRGSHKLYYITDWIDEFCDLTLDKFVETLQTSKEALKLKAKL